MRLFSGQPAPARPLTAPSRYHEALWWDDSNFDFKYIDGKHWKLKADFPFEYNHEGKKLVGVVPEGFVTNFHSVPRILWPIIHPFEFGQAATVHDYLYRIQEPRGLGDEIYLAALTKCGAGEARRKTMFSAVRIFGWIPYRKHKERLNA